MKDNQERCELLINLSEIEHEALPLRLHESARAAREILGEKPTHIWPNPDHREFDEDEAEGEYLWARAQGKTVDAVRLESDIVEVARAFNIDRATVRDLLTEGWVFTAWADGRQRFEKPAP